MSKLEDIMVGCTVAGLANHSVLEEAIRTGLNPDEYFAIAAGKSNDRFLELKYNQYVGMIDKSAYLVKIMSAKLDNTRINRDVQRLVEEVISHLTNVDGSRVEVCLEVNVDAPDGMPQTTVRTVSENCQTLKVKDFGFDD